MEKKGTVEKREYTTPIIKIVSLEESSIIYTSVGYMG